MNNEKRTEWFDAAQFNPHYNGWYEVESIGWKVKRFYWNGVNWHAFVPSFRGDGLVYFGMYPGDAWRGLMNPVPAEIPYTVILKRPRWLSNIFGAEPSTDIYIASVNAINPQRGLEQARKEVAAADRSDIRQLHNSVKTTRSWDYVLLTILEGHPKILVHGCTTGWWN